MTKEELDMSKVYTTVNADELKVGRGYMCYLDTRHYGYNNYER